MRLTTLFAGLALVLLPSFGMAMCGGMSHETASQCSEGTVFDPASGTCIAQTS